MRIDKLIPHRLHEDTFFNSTLEEQRDLMDDLIARGQFQPIMVLPANSAALRPNTVLDGHRCVSAMRAAGFKVADILVRHDLAEADEATVIAEFLKYNFVRRQLNKFEMALIAKRLFEIECRRSGQRCYLSDLTKMKQRFVATIGLTGKTLDRHMKPLDAHQVLRAAVEGRRLKMVVGVRLANLPAKKRRQIVDEVDGPTDSAVIGTVVGQYLEPPRARRNGPINPAAACMVGHLGNALNRLVCHVGGFSVRLLVRNVDILRRPVHVMREMIAFANDSSKPIDVVAVLRNARSGK